jgi:hypothetical protein
MFEGHVNGIVVFLLHNEFNESYERFDAWFIDHSNLMQTSNKHVKIFIRLNFERNWVSMFYGEDEDEDLRERILY